MHAYIRPKTSLSKTVCRYKMSLGVACSVGQGGQFDTVCEEDARIDGRPVEWWFLKSAGLSQGHNKRYVRVLPRLLTNAYPSHQRKRYCSVNETQSQFSLSLPFCLVIILWSSNANRSDAINMAVASITTVCRALSLRECANLSVIF